MIIKTGKYSFLVLFLLVGQFVFADPQISLRMLDTRNRAITKLARGAPGVLEVKVTDLPTQTQNSKPIITGLEKFTILGSQESSQLSINQNKGISQRTYRYTIRQDNPGNYTLGPARLDSLISPIINLEITPEQQQDKKAQDEVFVELLSNKKEYVVGEEIQLSIKFYFTNADIELKDLEPLKIENAQVALSPQIFFSNETQGDQVYTVGEIKATAIPEKSGELFIPALKLIYIEPIHNTFDPFRGFFGPQFGAKAAYTNPLKLIVHNLPSYSRQPDYIGVLNNITATLGQNKIDQGDVTTLKLTIEGQGDLTRVRTPQLKLPADVNFYESRVSVEAHKKYIEFVLQPLKAGKIEIPEQEILFFDPETKIYRVLKTAVLELFVEEKETENSTSLDLAVTSPTENSSLLTPHDITEKENYPFYYILILLVIGVLIWLVKTFLNSPSFTAYKTELLSKRALKRALKQVKQAENKDNGHVLLSIITQFFAHKLKISAATITPVSMRKILESSGFSHAELLSWDEFIYKLLRQSYYKSDSENIIFKEAKNWLSLLDLRLRSTGRF